MEGNFLSRLENNISEFTNKIDGKDCKDHRREHESDLAEYLLKCMPYIKAYADDDACEDDDTNRDNVFGAQETVGLKRGELYEDYMYHVEGVESAKPFRAHHRNIEYRCSACDSTNMCHFSETADLVCEDCGLVNKMLLSEELTYREEQESTSRIVNYAYKRENHFNEWLSQFQGIETTTIPDEVIVALREELKKMKIKAANDITHARVRGLLKKLRMNKYYEHVPFITNMLNGVRPPRMPIVLEERLRLMFKDIQAPFEKHVPASRKNFLSYSYVLYKFVELLSDYDEFLQYFPLLKSKEKLHQQDVIFEKICRELRWEFIPTI